MTGPIEDDTSEPYTNAADWEKNGYNAMIASVQKNKGFYIARFEAGKENGNIVSKKGVTVLGNLKWGDSMTEIGTVGAVYLAQSMYKNSATVVSTLCYGVQWDAIANFVSDAEHNIKDSKSWGNYDNSTGDAASNEHQLQTSGKNEVWKTKNIYDLPGNVAEWTMEASGTTYREARGGSWAENSRYGLSSRSNTEADSDVGVLVSYGFRPALYIK